MIRTQPIGKSLFDVDGELQIQVNGIPFFEEKEVLLFELGILMKKWLQKIDNGEVENFIYSSIEVEDGPVLEFRVDDYNQWEVYSDWKISNTRHKIPIDELKKKCREFLDILQAELKALYGLELNTDYV
ncbi:DUF7878 domain-containing protein [Paenibacillus cymbidii]|uniref:DUF7878 domain-containing protein n=1 Tax=Paenibacillus cymbidii TaxID=1639034 RepID=UPI001081A83C|nr:hypothetical protein [Paenibacillus cymbidii]